MSLSAFRARIFHCIADPGEGDSDDAVQYFDDGLLIVRNGRVEALGEYAELAPELPENVHLEDLGRKLIVPGFVDCHVHYPQIDIIGSYGERLLEWLEAYAFPAEEALADPEHAEALAEFFLDEMLQNGTTTALVFATVHPHSVDAIMASAQRRGMRLIAGKVLMDRNCPESLQEDTATGIEQSRQLIERWHGRDRLGYAITPRFAVTSSAEQLEAAGLLAAEYPDVHVHTHLAENKEEVAQVSRDFPDCRSYLDVYDRCGLLRERSVFAHCLHLDDADRSAMAAKGGAVAFCPTSNLFLGSGLLDLAKVRAAGVETGLATDVGGGTSMSQLSTLADAYKVLQLQGQSLHPYMAFYLATLGGARALRLDDHIGNFEPGKEADFVVIDCAATDILQRRTNAAKGVAEALFALMILGDDRAIESTYLLGEPWLG